MFPTMTGTAAPSEPRLAISWDFGTGTDCPISTRDPPLMGLLHSAASARTAEFIRSGPLALEWMAGPRTSPDISTIIGLFTIPPTAETVIKALRLIRTWLFDAPNTPRIASAILLV